MRAVETDYVGVASLCVPGYVWVWPVLNIPVKWCWSFLTFWLCRRFAAVYFPSCYDGFHLFCDAAHSREVFNVTFFYLVFSFFSVYFMSDEQNWLFWLSTCHYSARFVDYVTSESEIIIIVYIIWSLSLRELNNWCVRSCSAIPSWTLPAFCLFSHSHQNWLLQLSPAQSYCYSNQSSPSCSQIRRVFSEKNCLQTSMFMTFRFWVT